MNYNQNFEIIQKLKLDIRSMSKETGEISAICPLHEDKNASLYINMYTGKYHCFAGCIKGHSLRDLVFQLSGESVAEGNETNWLQHFRRKLNYKEEGFFGCRLPSIPILPLALGNEGGMYLKQIRGFTTETIQQWHLYFWKEENAVVIPIFKVGYILRYLGLGRGKYKYVIGTKVSNTLFGVENFQNVDNSIILVEGAFDCIWMHQNGFPNTLAILGSNLSDIQCKLLKGLYRQVKILMDEDEGGRKAAKEIVKKLNGEFIVKTCILPEGKDPNDCSKEEIIKAMSNLKC